jgi:hypothetical protein
MPAAREPSDPHRTTGRISLRDQYERRLRAVAETVAASPFAPGAFLEQVLGAAEATVLRPGASPPHFGPEAGPAPSFRSDPRGDDRWCYVALVASPNFDADLLVPPSAEETEPWEGGAARGRAVLQLHWLPAPGVSVALRARLAIAGAEEVAASPMVRGVCLRLRWATRHRFAATELPASRSVRRDFATGRLTVAQGGHALPLPPAVAARAAAVFRPLGNATTGAAPHTIVLGASGVGKTSYLAERASAAIIGGQQVVAVDVHGDLAPAIAARLSPPARARCLALDPTAIPGRSIGVRIVTGRDRPGGERAAAHLVAALRRLSAENGETYWGYRLERLFDAFVRIVQFEEGDLVDLYALFTDERRRDAARLATRDPETARFLDELAVLLRRTPDLLWPAASRLAKVATVGPLRALLAPERTAVDLDAVLADGRSILVRAPIGELGPEGSSFAATLLVGRLYLALTARERAPERPTLIVLDEAHAVAARLLVEVLAEGRKFGVDALLATQYAERLAPELRAAALGSAGRHVVFRTPRGGAIAAGTWLGLGAETAAVVLPQLPFGEAVIARPDDSLGVRIARLVGGPVAGGDEWTGMVSSTALEFGASERPAAEAPFREARLEALLLAVLGCRERAPGPVGLRSVIDWVVREEAEPVDPAAWLLSARLARQRGWLVGDDTDVALTPGGARFLGVAGATGATSESGEHRALLMEVFRCFARHGERLEIVRQGRFDRRLPDARCKALADGARALAPAQLARYLERRRNSWLWRCFGGRDVHVEAEVSGALRADRIRRGVEKARSAEAFALFVAADPRRARRIRSVLHAERLVPHHAQVWTLRGAQAARPLGTEEVPDEG